MAGSSKRFESTAYHGIASDHGPGVDDHVALLERNAQHSERTKRRACACRTLMVVAVILLLAGTFVGGLYTGWRWRPYDNKSDNKPQYSIDGGENSLGPKKDSGNSTTQDTENPVPDPPSNSTLPLPVTRPGTDFNADNIATSNGTGGFFLGAPISPDALLDRTKSPVAPTPENEACTFEYQPHLGFDGSTAIGSLLRPDGRLQREDVQQGSLGNCGFLAAIITLISAERQLELQRAIIQIGDTLAVRFRYPAANEPPEGGGAVPDSLEIVKIDDRIPRSTLTKEERKTLGCTEYLGALPPGVQWPSTPQTPIMYVPMLEKAWAKYTDAFPDLLRSRTSKNNGEIGYPGLQGTSAALVMQALTGQPAKMVRRKREGIDPELAAAILLCFLESRPCVVGTKDAAAIGTEAEPVVYTQIGSIATNNDESFYDVIEDATRRVLTFVSTHAYAIDLANSDFPDGEKIKYETAEVTIVNPWQYNYNYRVTDEEVSSVGAMKVRLLTLLYVMDTVYYV